MKGPLLLDRSRHDFGAAAPAVLSILAEWEAIDWFEPHSQLSDSGQAHLRNHQRLAHRYAPQQFRERVDIQNRHGGWADFVECCQSVRRIDAFDWKYSRLKTLSGLHNKRHDFSIAVAARTCLRDRSEISPHSLVMALTDTVCLWGSLGPDLDFSQLPKEAAESASFYRSYAHADALDAIQWQLAEPQSAIDENPFLPLLHCYAAGAYPFALSETRFVLFRFVTPAAPKNQSSQRV